MAPLSNSDSSGFRGKPLITGIGLAKRYGGVVAFSAEKISICENDRVLVLGSNGHGKSTLLRTLAGITLPSSGKLKVSKKLLHGRIGFLAQDGGFYPNLTVAQNIILARQLRARQAINDLRAMEFLGVFGLTNYLDQKVGSLSVGYQRLTAFAVTLAAEPQALILDEPLTSLDELKSLAVREYIDAILGDLHFIIASHHLGPLPFSPTSKLIAGDSGFTAST